MPAGHDKIEHRVRAQTVLVLGRKVAVFNDPFCFQVLSGTLIDDRASKQLLDTPQQLGRASSHSSDETFARLHHCCANSLVNVCDAFLKGVTNHSRGVLTEMRAARDLHTVPCTPHRSCARAGQEDAGLANVLTNATRNGCHVCLLVCSEIAHLRLVREDQLFRCQD